MKNLLNKIFLRSNNLDSISKNIKDLSHNTPIDKIFKAINSYSAQSEMRYVGGCVRKIINHEKVDDIDLCTNLEPKQVSEALNKNDIKFYETGIDHGTLTVIINEYKFEITSLREDISTDGRHAKVKFSKSWIKDASRRDFTFNCIYSDAEGNLFDPYNGKKDLEKGYVRFIGDIDKRIKEDYLRILRYLRFFINYSKHPHSLEIIKKLKINIGGISKLSKERLLDELKKIVNVGALEKLAKDKLGLEIFLIIFPELKNINFFSKIRLDKRKILEEADFIFLLSLMIIDGTDNSSYFLYKFKLSKKDQKRINDINNFFNEKVSLNIFSEKNMNKIFYYKGGQAVIDILHFQIIKSKKVDRSLIELVELYKRKKTPTMPIGANLLMSKYKISEGKQLGEKLKIIEAKWVNNAFHISDREVDDIVKS